MLQQAMAAYRRFARGMGRSASSRPRATLEVTALEERATPAASPTFVPTLAAPQTVLVGPNVAVPSSVSLATPMPGQTLVRINMGPGESTHAEARDDDANLVVVQHQQEADAPPVQANADNTAADEELAEMLEMEAAA